jgi:heptosyltransferase-1
MPTGDLTTLDEEGSAGQDFVNTSATRVQRILIVRLSSMGDVIHTMPAVALLRQAFPEASIGWMIEERWAELLVATGTPRVGPCGPPKPLVEAVHAVNMKAWRRAPFSEESWRQALWSRRELRRGRYELALDFQGAIRSAMMARWAGVPTTIGFDQPREHAAGVFYARTVEGHGVHVIEQSVSLVAAITGCPAIVPATEFPIDDKVEEWCTLQIRKHGITEFAILNPGAGWGAKQWPAERYGKVAKGLARYGLRSLVNFGPGEESLARQVESTSGGAAEGVPCSITELIALTRRARLFVGGDTGPMHLASALRVPVVAIFGPTNPARNGPFGTRSVVLRSATSSTTHARRRRPDAGLLTISSDEVLRAAGQLLEGGVG